MKRTSSERTCICAMLSFCGLALLTAAGCQHAVAPDVAAQVNGRAITFTDMDRALAEQFPNAPLKKNDDQTTELKLEALRALIDDQIMVQRAEKAGLLASDSDVDAKLNEIKAPYTQEQFKKLLDGRKLTLDEFKARVRRELSVQKLFNKEIGSHISISDTDITSFYNANKASFNFAENQVRIAQILVTPGPDPSTNNLKNDKAQNEEQAKSKVQNIEVRLKQGEDFGTLAQNYSEDSKTAPNGGDFGYIPESTLEKATPELRRLILTMTPGQISQVIRTAEGYRIIKLISKEPAGQRLVSDPRVQENIRRELFQRKDQLLRSAFYEVARSEAKIQNYFAQSVLASRDKK